jgi:hypothetical protein
MHAAGPEAVALTGLAARSQLMVMIMPRPCCQGDVTASSAETSRWTSSTPVARGLQPCESARSHGEEGQQEVGTRSNGNGKAKNRGKPRELQEYPEGTTFPGVIGRTFDVSRAAWPRSVRARPGMPNVLYIVLDDTGFGQLGCYGSPIRTPNIDRLARHGLRYSNMHTTALCSPTRSCLLTGRNHHSNHMACITEGATGFPGYDGTIPFENGFVSELLHDQPSMFVVGNGTDGLERDQRSGPYDRPPDAASTVLRISA